MRPIAMSPRSVGIPATTPTRSRSSRGSTIRSVSSRSLGSPALSSRVYLAASSARLLVWCVARYDPPKAGSGGTGVIRIPKPPPSPATSIILVSIVDSSGLVCASFSTSPYTVTEPSPALSPSTVPLYGAIFAEGARSIESRAMCSSPECSPLICMSCEESRLWKIGSQKNSLNCLGSPAKGTTAPRKADNRRTSSAFPMPIIT